jgi:hypothetical protein
MKTRGNVTGGNRSYSPGSFVQALAVDLPALGVPLALGKIRHDPWVTRMECACVHALADTHDVNGNAVIAIDSTDAITLTGVTTAQLAQHPADIHIL